MKHIFIINGHPRSGKTTFGRILSEFIPCNHISIIDPVKELAKQVGWDPNSKDERDRKFLSDLKDLTESYSDFPFQWVIRRVNEFLCDDDAMVLLIDMREPRDIERAVQTMGAQTIFIKNKRGHVTTTNHADAGVEQYIYDIVIENNGTLEEFRESICAFAEGLKGE